MRQREVGWEKAFYKVVDTIQNEITIISYIFDKETPTQVNPLLQIRLCQRLILEESSIGKRF